MPIDFGDLPDMVPAEPNEPPPPELNDLEQALTDLQESLKEVLESEENQAIPLILQEPEPELQDLPEGIVFPTLTEEEIQAIQNTATTIEGGTAPPLPEPEPEPIPEYTVWIVHDSDHPDVRNVVVNEDGELFAYLPEGVMVKEIAGPKIKKYLDSGATKFAAARVMSVVVDPMLQRACKWYSPSSLEVAKGGELAEGYKFDKPYSHGSCSNPVMIKHSHNSAPACRFTQCYSGCPVYEPEPYEVVKAVHDPIIGSVVKIVKTRRNYGIPEYSIVRRHDENAEDDAPFETILCDDPNVNWDEKITMAWDGQLDALGFKDPDDVTHKFTSEVTKEAYFNHVIHQTA